MKISSSLVETKKLAGMSAPNLFPVFASFDEGDTQDTPSFSLGFDEAFQKAHMRSHWMDAVDGSPVTKGEASVRLSTFVLIHCSSQQGRLYKHYNLHSSLNSWCPSFIHNLPEICWAPLPTTHQLSHLHRHKLAIFFLTSKFNNHKYSQCNSYNQPNERLLIKNNPCLVLL